MDFKTRINKQHQHSKHCPKKRAPIQPPLLTRHDSDQTINQSILYCAAICLLHLSLQNSQSLLFRIDDDDDVGRFVRGWVIFAVETRGWE